MRSLQPNVRTVAKTLSIAVLSPSSLHAMRTKRGVLLTAVLLSQAWRACASLTHHGFAPDHAPVTKRDDIGGLLGGFGGQEPHRTEQVSATNIRTESTQPTHPPSSTLATPAQVSKSAETASKTTQQEHTEEKEKTANAITGTGPPISAAPITPSHTNTFVSNSVIPYPTGPAITGLPEKEKGPGTDWRVIGVAVIAVSVIATAILSVIFFDQWTRFLRDLCGGRRKKHRLGGEELVPDWKRGSWDFKSAREDKVAEPEVLAGQNVAGVGRDGMHVAAREALDIPARPFFRPASNPFEPREASYPVGFVAHGYASPEPPNQYYYPQSPHYDNYPNPAYAWSPAHTGLHRSGTNRAVREGNWSTPANTGLRRSDTVTEDAYGGMA